MPLSFDNCDRHIQQIDTCVNRRKRTKCTSSENMKHDRTDTSPSIFSQPSTKTKMKRQFDWSKAAFGKFLMKIAYIGSNYSGIAWQPTPDNTSHFNTSLTINTVEGAVFEAMKKTYLIKDRNTSCFSRCGRTDKGVHAAGNYICARLRLKQINSIDSQKDDSYDYAKILNAVLPHDIRIVDVCRVPDHFDARFQCLYRVYKYVFPVAGYDISLMAKAAEQFVGEHDFRNFCKIDAERVRHFRRKILWFKFSQVDPYVWEAEIAGLSFLWHQVRCMMSVLFLIGRHLELPSIIPTLLDTVTTARKPAYELAEPSGLILYECFFEGLHFSKNSYQIENVKTLKTQYLQHLQSAAVFKCLSLNGNEFSLMSNTLPDATNMIDSERMCNNACNSVMLPPRTHYKSILSRPTSMSLEERRQIICEKIAEKEKSLSIPIPHH